MRGKGLNKTKTEMVIRGNSSMIYAHGYDIEDNNEKDEQDHIKQFSTAVSKI